MTLVVSQTTCPSNQVYVHITKKSTIYANEESFKILAGETVIYSTTEPFSNNHEDTIIQCLAPTTNHVYTLRLLDEYGDSWSQGAWISLKGINGNTVLKAFMIGTGANVPEDLTFSLYSPINKGEAWKYAGAYADQWNTQSFADDAWTEVNTESPVPTSVAGTQYFRKAFVGVTGMAAIEVQAFYQAGLVAYINGVEIWRDNMPVEGVIAQDTLATGSYSTAQFHGVIRSANGFENAQSVLAIELHFVSAEHSQAINFNAFLSYLAGNTADSACFTVANEVSTTGDIAFSMVEQMSDWGFSYASISASDIPASAYFVIGGVSRPIITGIRVYSHNDEKYTPTILTMYGGASAAATEWTLLLDVTSLQNAPKSYAAVESFSSFDYPAYKVTFQNALQTTVQLYELQFLVCNNPVPTTFSYSEESYTLYATYSSINAAPTILGLTSCTGNLPAGLTLNPTTCTITGTATTAAPQTTYTITGMIGTSQLTGTITITVESCTTTMLDVRMVHTYYPDTQAFRLRNTATNEMILEMALDNTHQAQSEVSYLLCVNVDRYDITVDSSGSYWASKSYLYVYSLLPNNEREMVVKARFDNNAGTPSTYYLRPNTITPASQWYYKMGEVPANWHSSDVSGWTQGSYGAYPESSNQVQLYKKTFSVSDINLVSGYSISVRYQYGCVIYLNGHEAVRVNIPAGDLTAATTADGMHQSLKYYTVVLPGKTIAMNGQTSVNFLQSGTNTIAIGLFALNTASQKTSYFDATVRLLTDSSQSVVLDHTATASSDVSIMYDGPFSQDYTDYISGSSCASNEYVIVLADARRVWTSSVEVMASYYNANNHVKQFKLYGRNADTEAWTLLKDVSGLTWSVIGQKRRVYFQNNNAYNQFKFENLSNGNPDDCYWFVQSLRLYADNVLVEPAPLGYDTNVSVFKDIEMAEVTPASTEGYISFAVSPALPPGLVLDPATGWISGTPITLQTAIPYTITATKLAGGTVTATINLEVATCSDTRGLMTFRIRADGFADENSWKLYQGRGTTGTVLRQVEQFPVSGGLYYVDFCLDNGIYTFEGMDSYGDGWSTHTGYTLTVDLGAMEVDMNQLASDYDAGESKVTTTFSTYFPFQAEYTEWKFYQGAEIASTWNMANFNDATWTAKKAIEIPNSEYTTTYIRKTFTMTNIADYQVLNVRIKYTGGVAAYFNGNLVARFNLEENFNAATEGLERHDMNIDSKFHVILAPAGMVEGTNVMAFEIHRPAGASSSEPFIFDATGVFGVEDCSTVVDTYTEMTSNYDTQSIGNIFDLDPSTYWYMANEVNNNIDWTVENLLGSQWNSFNTLIGTDVTGLGIAFYGWFNPEDSDEDRIDVHDVVGLSITGRTKPQISVPVALAGFRKFRYEITVGAYGMEYDSILMAYCKATGATCPAIDNYPSVGEGQISPAACPIGFKGYSYRECVGGALSAIKTDFCHYKDPVNVHYSGSFNLVMGIPMTSGLPTYENIVTSWRMDSLTPLPAGLTLNQATGEITGTPTEEVKSKVYTIYAANPEKSAFTTISINIRKGVCLAEGDFPQTEVGKVAVYPCSEKGSYIGTQERACILGAVDGEWQSITGFCMSIGIIVIIILVAILIIAVVVFILIKSGKKGKKTKMAKAGKKGGKVTTPKATTPKAGASKKPQI